MPERRDVIPREERLDEALRRILDVTSGWTRPMTTNEALTTIHKIAEEAIRG